MGNQAKLLIVLPIVLLTSMSVHAQQTDNSQDSADVSAAQAAIQRVQKAAQKLKAATPDAATMHEAEYQQHMRDLDAESKTDAEIAKEKITGISKDLADKAADKVREGLGNAAESSSSLTDVFDTGKAFFDASTPSYTAGPSKDQIPTLTPEQQQNLDSQLNQWSAAQKQYDQAIQDAADAASKYITAHPSTPQVKPSGPTIAPAPKICPSGSVCTTH